ncbi:Acyl-CoA dehydrogenase domain-containing protein [Sterolibacterium denitrificans]|uniref:Acyl-CoA dehydrogenase domain-containing protein n=1 Tax=Sterolibacterium denitrificans TaxID=157592 RepID=A0A7Z7HQG4_9PROT|nr:acyl-CoA dehydrogenase [Sterolibacterium denitrificans]SMB25068.1 Acyl-CoA dehydrogenase domain-containing protein [Sterolibacterium denitrificans]
MGLLFNEEQRLLQETAQDYFQNHFSTKTLREMREGRDALGYVPKLWQQMAEMGWTGILASEDQGGLGFGFQGVGAVLEPAGKTLAGSPFLATVVLGGSALQLGGNEAQRNHWLPKLIAGEVRFALAIDEGPRHDPKVCQTTATKNEKGYILNGSKQFVMDGGCADQLIVSADTGKGQTLFLVDAQAQGISRHPLTMIDTRNAARIVLDNVQVDADAVLGSQDEGLELLDQILDRGRIALCAEMLGIAQWLFDTTIDYLKQRVQFDVLIGSFQALQHRAAKMFVQMQLARSSVLAALSIVDENPAFLPFYASAAKAKMGEVLELVSSEAVQMHGGIGVTDELDVGLYLKRGRVCVAALGDVTFHRDRVAGILGI